MGSSPTDSARKPSGLVQTSPHHHVQRALGKRPCPTEPCSGCPGLSCPTAQIPDRVPHWPTDPRGRAGTLCGPVCPCPGPQQLCQSWGAVGSFLPLTWWAGAKSPLFGSAGEPCAHGPTGSCPRRWRTCSRGSTGVAAQGMGSGSPGEQGQGGDGSSRVAGFVCSVYAAQRPLVKEASRG